jgi:hypothetical protein
LSLIILQHVPPLCDYKVWIDTEKCVEVKHFLRNMVEQNMMAEKFRVRRMKERKRATYFTMQREMKHEYKEKREEERAPKREKARHAKEAYARGGEKALMNAKWSRLTQD